MSGESDEDLCRRLAQFLGSEKELREKWKEPGRRTILQAIHTIFPDNERYMIRRLESAGCLPPDLLDELGPHDPNEEEEEEDL